MASKYLVGELIEYYYQLEDIIEGAGGRAETDIITDLKDLQHSIDKTLTNISRRWAMGNKRRGYVPIRHVHDEDNPYIVQVCPLLYNKENEQPTLSNQAFPVKR